MILTDIKLTEKDFNNFKPFPKCSDRTFYNNLNEKFKKDIIENGNKYFHLPIPIIKATDYLEYTRTGNRTNFQELYFNRRRALASLTLAECVADENKYIDKIIDLIIFICEESGWQLPAHNNSLRDKKVFPFPNIKSPVLDLFALETSALLSTVAYLLEHKLSDEYSFIIDRIVAETRERIVTPYLENDFWWTGANNEPTLNWTVWCTQNLLLTVFFNNWQDHVKVKVANKAIKSLQAFLNDYHEDGCCDEGAEYYRHAGLCFFGAVDILNQVTNNKFDFVYEKNKVKNIANYIKNVHVHNEYYFNFADCSAVPGYSSVREYLFGKKIKDEDLINFALVQHNNITDVSLPNEINLFYKVQSVITSMAMKEEKLPSAINYQDIYYEGVGVFIARDNRLALAVKTGSNNDNHNHNDTGSFTIFKDGIPFIIDVGVEDYSAKTFSPKRYEIWTMQSSYHNLPDFDNVMESPGEEFKATNISTFFDKGKSTISMNLEKAYDITSQLKEFKRKVTLNKNENIVVEDFTIGKFKKSILNLMFWKEPIIDDNNIIVENLGTVILNGNTSIYKEKVVITDDRLKKAWGDNVYRIRITYEKNLSLTVL